MGLWENKEYKGCVIYSHGATPNIGSPFNLDQTQICELTRVALNKHETPTSKVVSESLKLLKKHNPNLELVVSYADVDQTHLGIIYQATNWIYLGHMGDGIRSAFIIHGKKVHPKTIYDKGLKQSLETVKKHLDPNATEFYTQGKHKYVMPLNKRQRKLLSKQALPYPKVVRPE